MPSQVSMRYHQQQQHQHQVHFQQLLSKLVPLTSASFEENHSLYSGRVTRRSSGHQHQQHAHAGDASYTWYQHYKSLLLMLHQEILSQGYLYSLRDSSGFHSLKILLSFTNSTTMSDMELASLPIQLEDVKRMIVAFSHQFKITSSQTTMNPHESLLQVVNPSMGESQFQGISVPTFHVPFQHMEMVPPAPPTMSPVMTQIQPSSSKKGNNSNKKSAVKQEALPFQSPPPIDRRRRKSSDQMVDGVLQTTMAMGPIAMEGNFATFLWGDEHLPGNSSHQEEVPRDVFLPPGPFSMPSDDVMSLVNSLPANKEEFISCASSVVTTATNSSGNKKKRKSAGIGGNGGTGTPQQVQQMSGVPSAPSTPNSASKRGKHFPQFDRQKIEQDLQEINSIITKARAELPVIFETNQLNDEDRKALGNSLNNINLECRIFETTWSRLLEEKKK
jgi:hypothetical protein